MSVETVIGDIRNTTDIQNSNIPQYVFNIMEIHGGYIHHGDRAIFYVPERFSDYCLNNLQDRWDKYNGIIVVRVIIRPSLKYLADYSKKDIDVTCVGAGVVWMGVRVGDERGWSAENSLGKTKKYLSNIGWHFSELDPNLEEQKTCVIEAGEFRNPNHALTIKVDMKSGSAHYSEEIRKY